MDQGSQDRNLPASERKKRKAREDGQVSRSQDLSHLAVLSAGAICTLTLAPALFQRLQWNISQQLSFDAASLKDVHLMLDRLSQGSLIGLAACIVFATAIAAASVTASVASGGWVQSLKPLMPDLNRINPLSGFANMFSKKKLVTVGKTVLLMVLLFAVAALFLRAGMEPLSTLILQPSASAIQTLAEWLRNGMGLLLLVILLAALIDVPVQKLLHLGDLKMSRHEVKQEGKESDGNPQMKSKMRQRQREMSQKSSVNAVPKADFVVMNPTHFAVAIRYDDKTMGAPQVISKGTDLLAMKIRDIAKSHSIPVLQSPMLARALYANSELNQDIPSALYTAVAQVLAYVYRLRAAMHGQGPMPGDMPTPFVPPELDPLSKTVAAA